MRSYACTICAYGYRPGLGDPENGIPPGTPFEDLPDSWRCPWCGATKAQFRPEEEQRDDFPKGNT